MFIKHRIIAVITGIVLAVAGLASFSAMADADPTASLEVMNIADPSSSVRTGEEVTFTVTVRNTGGVRIDDITLEDSLMTGEPVQFSLEPGETSVRICTYTVTDADADAGSFRNTATATAADPNNPNQEVRASGTASVTTVQTQPNLVQVSIPTIGALTYNGDYQIPLLPTAAYSLTGNTREHDAGSYTMTAHLKDGYAWSDGTTEDKVIQWKIKPREVTITPVNTTYYIGEQKPTVSVTISNGIEGESFVGSVRRDPGDEPGDYILYFDVDETQYPNYDITTRTGVYSIVQKIDVPTQSGTLTYNGQEQTVSLTGSGIVMDDEKSKGINAGSYTVTVFPDVWHCWQDKTRSGKEVEWSIEPKSIVDATVQMPEENLVYTGEKQEIHPTTVTLDGKELKEGIDYKVDYLSGATNPGHQQIAVRGIGNYAGLATDAAIDYTIDKGTLDVPKPTGRLTYNGEQQACPIPKDNDHYTLSGDLYATQPGKYTVTVHLDSCDFYDWSDGTTADQTITWYIDGNPEDETTPTNGDDNGKSEESVTDKTDNANNSATSTKASNNSGTLEHTGDTVPLGIFTNLLSASVLVAWLARRKSQE